MIKKKTTKKIRVALAIIGLALSIVTLVYLNNQRESNQLIAHPTSSITLDNGLSTEYTVKPDATQLLEPELIDQSPVYDEYLQGSDIVPTIEKIRIEGVASPMVPETPSNILRMVSWSVVDIAETSQGNFVVLYAAKGNNVGGVVKLSIFNIEGVELATYEYGDLKNAIFRLATGFYATENNQFLVYPSGRGDGSTYIRFDVNENANPIQISATQFTGTGAAAQGTALKSYLTYRVAGKKAGIDKDNPEINAQIYFSSLARMGTIAGRVPIGKVNNVGWQSGTGMDTKYVTSLETDNPIPSTQLTAIKNAYIDPIIGENQEGYYYGRIDYIDFRVSSDVKVRTTFQVFDNTDSNINGQLLRKKIFEYEDTNQPTALDVYSLRQLHELTTETELYFLSCEATMTKLIKVDLTKINKTNINAYKGEVIKQFPPYTVLEIAKNSNGTLSYYGSTTDISNANNNDFYSEFYSSKLNSSNYYVQGIMGGTTTTNPFDVISVKALEVSDIVNPKFIHAVNTPEKDKLFVAGDTMDHDNFVDKMTYIDKDGNHSSVTPAYKGLVAFAGVLRIEDDYAPAMSGFEDMMLNINDKSLSSPTLNAYDWRVLDNWLITGTKTGSLTDSKAIKLADVKDYENTLIGSTLADREKYLAMRINRNVNNLGGDIDWDALGFDKTYPGPQLATYFANDSQNQQTVMSRWVNKITDRTVIDKDHYLDVHDFTYELSKVGELSDKELVKRLSRIVAWYIIEETENGVTKKKAIEDENTLKNPAVYDHSAVTFDASQLADIMNAKKAAPYPLVFTYKGTDQDGNPVELKNRVTIFLTDETFDDENGYANDPQRELAIYAEDYSRSLYLAKDEDATKVYNTSDIKVYEFDKDRNTEGATTITLADKNKQLADLTPDSVLLRNIQNADYPQKMPMEVTYEGVNSKGETVKLTGKIVVTLIPEVLLHLRQVVVSPLAELVVPTEGYANLNNVKLADPSQQADLSYHVITSSDLEANLPLYKKIIVPFEFDYDEPDLTKQYGGITVSNVIPEYYQYEGHALTYHKTDPNGVANMVNSEVLWPIIDDKEHHEAWLTIFIKPTLSSSDHPRPYSWDYRLNELGEVIEP
ncbi:hypothetical protein I6N95_04340 [Vagococcus sp. BWB3-3]|uniref:Uncharacterized protein n=1 Tax=Vagococcus allomyrinae TaxID=2794353 RepID=A0A940P2F7_9ENTE|nr:hypothetical protein [Vagococcus allomyrinae]MBP1040237.1 hypothetical protein [Vagococcus allomyrinae]